RSTDDLASRREREPCGRGHPAPFLGGSYLSGSVSLSSRRCPAMSAQRPHASLARMSLGVNDLSRSKLFYDAALAPLGLVPHLQIPGEVAYGPPSGEDPVEGFAFYIGFENPAARRRVSPS